jgi:hypothetical protein
MDCSRDLLYYKSYLWVFPSRKIEIVSVGTRLVHISARNSCKIDVHGLRVHILAARTYTAQCDGDELVDVVIGDPHEA